MWQDALWEPCISSNTSGLHHFLTCVDLYLLGQQHVLPHPDVTKVLSIILTVDVVVVVLLY